MRGGLPAASEVFAALPDALPDDGTLREAVRALRAEDGLLLGVIDDDPTGSQSVHGVQVVTVLAQDALRAALGGPAGTCFAVTNSRSLGEPEAAGLTARAARGLIAAARHRGGPLQLVSRSDSTLRGHVMTEVAALTAVQREACGRGFDGVLLIPAFLEAGRLTAAGIHWARTPGGLVPVSETEFARDATFGYRSAGLREFVSEKSGGTIAPGEVMNISLTDIRRGGPARVAGLLAGVHDGQWVAVDATEYSDLEAVACGALLARRAGASLLMRTGPSFVRALAGLAPQAPLRGEALRGTSRPGGHGLVVAGSHVGRTSAQLAALRDAGAITGAELDVPDVLRGDAGVVAATAQRVTSALARSDVLLYTSRTVVTGDSPAASLAIARRVSAAVSRVVAGALSARPAWVIAKGGITAHDVARHGLGIRRAEVAGQLFPGLISVFRAIDAAPAAIGIPYVVFAGNVGDDQALARVVALLRR